MKRASKGKGKGKALLIAGTGLVAMTVLGCDDDFIGNPKFPPEADLAVSGEADAGSDAAPLGDASELSDGGSGD